MSRDPGPRFGSLRDHTSWALGSLGVGLACVGVFVSVRRSDFEDRWQTWLGVAAGVLLLAGMLLSLFKRRPLGRLRPWYLLHLWALLLWGPVAWMHADGSARGVFYAVLAGAGWLAWLTGLAGVLLQRALAKQRRLGSAEDALLEDLLAERDRLRSEMADLMSGQQQLFETACRELSQPLPGQPGGLRSLLGRVFRPELADARTRARMKALAGALADQPAELVERVSEDALELEHCLARIALQEMRTVWLTAHVVAAVPLLTLTVVHVLAILRY